MTDGLFLGSKITADGDCSPKIRRWLLLGRKSHDKPRQCVEKQRCYSANKVHIVRVIVFPVVTYGCKSWTIKMAEHQRIDAFKLWCWRRILSPLDSKEIKPVNPKGDQPWILVGRTDAEAPIVWSSDVNSQLIGKHPDSGKDWGQKKRASEDEMDGWHHRCNGHEHGQTSGDGEGQEGLACCSPWGHKELDTTGWLNNNISLFIYFRHYWLLS